MTDHKKSPDLSVLFNAACIKFEGPLPATAATTTPSLSATNHLASALKLGVTSQLATCLKCSLSHSLLHIPISLESLTSSVLSHTLHHAVLSPKPRVPSATTMTISFSSSNLADDSDHTCDKFLSFISAACAPKDLIAFSIKHIFHLIKLLVIILVISSLSVNCMKWKQCKK
jgi:hypothetical protein